ncbi:Na/Pi cotransporter family protein [Streptobacillus moniliformis]|uniref:Na/Pi cotransporter family protein n=1 Tax=Streptobacillus moniliformis TaxID=34105 RepID=UPI0007E3C986|nr:Na/Pi cotransporter family protein [Streptobacillus moniliformis]QXW65272.1 Na/Pi cotransporter family protein [Streptobacillus moniliformis]
MTQVINYREMIFTFLGGLGLFLFCIKYMGEGLQLMAGEKLRYILDKYTTSPFLGVLVGVFVTGLIQSSSGTSVITIGLVGAGLLTLRQAIGIIMGANIGTTITAVIIGFNISRYALPILFIGVALLTFTNRKSINNIGRVIFGFGGLFFALSLMSKAMHPLRSLPAFVDLTVDLSKNSLLGVFIGTVLTMIVQSSSATVGILQNIYHDNLITLRAALPVLFGDNIGTTITAIIAVIGASSAAKRIALSHVLFNVIGATIFMIFLSPFTLFVEKMSKFFHLSPKLTIGFAHGTFNILNTILLFPFIGVLAYIVTKVIKDDKIDEEYTIKYLDRALIQTPSIALGQVKQEMLLMIEVALENLKKSVEFFHTHDEKLAEEIKRREEGINTLDREITKYLSDLSRENLSEKEGEELGIYLDMCRDVERIGDHADGILMDVEYEIRKSLKFSEYAHNEINNMLQISTEMIECAIEAIKHGNKEKVFEALDLHNRVYAYEKKIRKNHIKRINLQECEIHAGLSYIDLISHFTRVCDHARNLVEKV